MLTVVAVVVGVGAPPDARWRKQEHPVRTQQDVCQDGAAQDRAVLVVMVDDEHADHRQARQDAPEKAQPPRDHQLVELKRPTRIAKVDQKCNQLRHRTSWANSLVALTNSLVVRRGHSDS
jgi:hypothetical protein